MTARGVPEAANDYPLLSDVGRLAGDYLSPISLLAARTPYWTSRGAKYLPGKLGSNTQLAPYRNELIDRTDAAFQKEEARLYKFITDKFGRRPIRELPEELWGPKGLIAKKLYTPPISGEEELALLENGVSPWAEGPIDAVGWELLGTPPRSMDDMIEDALVYGRDKLKDTWRIFDQPWSMLENPHDQQMQLSILDAIKSTAMHAPKLLREGLTAIPSLLSPINTSTQELGR